MNVYERLRVSTPAEISVDPIAFLNLYERMAGDTPDEELLLDQLMSMDSVHLEDLSSRAKRPKEGSVSGGKGASASRKQGIGR